MPPSHGPDRRPHFGKMTAVVQPLKEAVAADCWGTTIAPDERNPCISIPVCHNPSESAAPLTRQSMIKTFSLLNAPASPPPPTAASRLEGKVLVTWPRRGAG